MPEIPARGSDDPIAQRTGWDPLVSGGANFRTRELVVVSPDRLEFKASRAGKLFGGVFLMFGLGALVAGVAASHWVPLLFGLVFGGIGLFLIRTGTAPVVFDRRERAFWRGRTAPSESIRRQDLKHYAELDEIHALQILQERVRGKDGSYFSYELNLVLADGRRLNVTDHGDYRRLRQDADTVSQFLNRPVWDTVPSEETD